MMIDQAYNATKANFFFRAEDGIRVLYVTGVQTCALPILVGAGGLDFGALQQRIHPAESRVRMLSQATPARSEERRVGKECTSGRGPKHSIIKMKAIINRSPVVPTKAEPILY